VAGGGSSREPNFWPGFVDALTNLVLVLVFVVVVFTFALFYFASQLAKQKISEIQAKYEKAAFEKVVKPDELKQLRQSRAEALRNASASPQLDQARAGGTPSNGASTLGPRVDIERDASQAQPTDQGLPVIVAGQGGAVVLSFAPGVADLSVKETGQVDAALGTLDGSRRYELTAEPAEPSPSEGQRLAYYRIAAIRNHLVAQGVPPQNIDMTIASPAPKGMTRSRVVIGTKAGAGQ